ncbi:MAG: cell division topological specificity factor MinE [Vulcanimicrobiaceae bacterium]
MIDFIKKLFGQSDSSTTAKERLRLVLMTDHLALAPEIVEQMKRDLIDVISRYVEVDRDKVEVNFEREDRALAMLANIPIVSVNRPKGGDGLATRAPKPADAALAAPSTVMPSVANGTEMAAVSVAPPKRRRRKKSQNLASQQPAASH